MSVPYEPFPGRDRGLPPETTGFGGANIDALAAARSYVNAGKRTKEGVRCPCCEQYCKIYSRSITPGMARWLMELVFRSRRDDRWYKANEDWSVDILRGSGDYAKLRLWGLIAESPEGGRWSPTPLGIDFVNNRANVQEKALVYNDTFQGFAGDPVWIGDVLTKKFNYAALMAEAP